MPVKLPDKLPAIKKLYNENIFVINKIKNKNFSLPTLKILILNLMPNKIETEKQIIRLLSHCAIQINVKLLKIDNRESKNTPIEHIKKFYCSFKDIINDKFDGLIITGAPLGLINFTDVIYWQKIKNIIIWAKYNVTSTLFLCWAAQAALNIIYNIPKITKKNKILGVYKHRLLKKYSSLTHGFDDIFFVPHSRYADFPNKIITDNTDLDIKADSEHIGAYLFASKDKKLVFVTGHPEYDYNTLTNEYYRDSLLGLKTKKPINYAFTKNTKENINTNVWRSHGILLFNNWLSYYIYLNKYK